MPFHTEPPKHLSDSKPNNYKQMLELTLSVVVLLAPHIYPEMAAIGRIAAARRVKRW